MLAQDFIQISQRFLRPLHCTEGTTECAALEVDSRYTYPCMIYFYPEKLDVCRLQSALSRVLVDFPQYAGKVVKRGIHLEIRHGEGAVSFESARVPESFASWLSDPRARETRRLEPRASSLKMTFMREPAMLVRVTEASDGCALAVGWNHAVGDTHSTMLLMRAWAAAYRGRPYERPEIVTDRDAYLRAVLPYPSTARSAVRCVGWSELMAYRMAFLRPAVRVGADYSWSQLEVLRRSLSSHGYVSVNDALCSHVASALRRMSGAMDRTNLCMVVNYRRRIGLPENIIGNMLSMLVQPLDHEDTPQRFALRLRAGLEDFADKHLDYHASMRVLDANRGLSARTRMVSQHFRPGNGDLFVTNWNNFGAYDLQFGASKPVLFHPSMLGFNISPWVMIVYERAQASGLAVTVSLPEPIARRWSSPEGQALLIPQYLNESLATPSSRSSAR